MKKSLIFLVNLLAVCAFATIAAFNNAPAQIVTQSPPSLPLSVANGGWGTSGTAWSTYTPTLSCGTGTFTSASAAGRSLTVGKVTFLNVVITITTNGTCASFTTFTLPNTLAVSSFAGGRSSNGNLVGGAGAAAGASISFAGATGTYVGGDGTTITINTVYENQ